MSKLLNFLTGASCALVLGSASLANAGDRELELMFVNMTPDAISSANTACARLTKLARLTGATRFMGEKQFRERTNKVGDTSSFLTWQGSDLQAARDFGDKPSVDTIVLADCRANSKELSLLVVPPDNDAIRIVLRNRTLTVERLRAILDTAMLYAWSGFTP